MKNKLNLLIKDARPLSEKEMKLTTGEGWGDQIKSVIVTAILNGLYTAQKYFYHMGVNEARVYKQTH